MEISTPNEYYYRTYWTPRIFVDTLREARQIQGFIDKFVGEFNIGVYYKRLNVPRGTYKRNGTEGTQINSRDESRGSAFISICSKSKL